MCLWILFRCDVFGVFSSATSSRHNTDGWSDECSWCSPQVPLISLSLQCVSLFLTDARPRSQLYMLRKRHLMPQKDGLGNDGHEFTVWFETVVWSHKLLAQLLFQSQNVTWSHSGPTNNLFAFLRTAANNFTVHCSLASVISSTWLTVVLLWNLFGQAWWGNVKTYSVPKTSL